MAKEVEIGTATPADLASDVVNHRRTYQGFVKLMTFAAIGTSIALIIVFLILK